MLSLVEIRYVTHGCFVLCLIEVGSVVLELPKDSFCKD